MSSLIAQESILEVQRATDIVNLVGEYLPLKRAGTSLKALCPFHDEKTPSFSVSPTRQTFHCFGCGKGGNVFGFVMEMDKVTFPEAVRHLAERAGVTLRETGGVKRREDGLDRNELYRVHRWAVDFYHRRLLDAPDAAGARAYLAERGLTPATIGRFLLGYAPDAWDGLLRAAAKKGGIPVRALQTVGLAMAKADGEGHYDRFRHRVMFPIFDTRDHAIAFGARVLPGPPGKTSPEARDPGSKPPKYINTPETPIFSKGREFYALNWAKPAISKAGALGIMEGYTDVILAHQFGFEHFVATLGTAMTREHVRLARRYTERVTVLYDADAAGIKASERSLDLFLEEDLSLSVATLPAGLDPADCLLQRGAEVFAESLAKSEELFAYRMRSLRTRHATDTVSGRAAAVDGMLDTLAGVTNPVVRDLQLQRLSAEFGVPERTLRERLAGIVARRAGLATRRSDTAAREKAAGAEQARPAEAEVQAATPAARAAGLELIEILLTRNDLAARVRSELGASDFPTPESAAAARVLFAELDRSGSVDASTFLTLCEDRVFSSALSGQLERAARLPAPEKRLDGHLKYVSGVLARRRAAELREAVRKKGAAGSSEDLGRYLERLSLEQRNLRG
ncbi:MAG: DNA primase [Planctomycetes bacterium]|nr:DNA primase [Planctomycetota bacterium]